MTLQQYIITDFRDPTWLNNYIAAMGEEAFWNYKRKLYFMLDQLKIGECIEVQTWVKPENLDLFMKISCCFVQESRCCYCFSNDFQKIIHQFDKKENDTLVQRAKALRIQALSPQATPTDSL